MEQPTIVKEDECDWVSAPEFPGLQYKLLIDSTKINNHGLSLGSLELVPGGELPLHHHSPQEIYIIRKGKGLLLSKSERREVFPETSIYIPKNEKHGLKNIGDDNLLIYWIFPTDCWADVRYLYGE
ncbi:MAG: cupin domain-containing protein [Rhodobacteraceae bacterium]|nr:cupin domain-containing protein [Paracoccaceae bacterium]|tara:strand:- start:4380 stop:4757 length:378 start_codon:yes stop_codon:yes gene_type:complete